MAGAPVLVAVAVAEAGDRAEDGGLGDDDAQPLEHAGPEAVEDDVGLAHRASLARPASRIFRSQTTDSLPALTASCQAGRAGRIGSPSGGSTWTTRAPSRMSSRLANGPGR